MAPPPTYEYDSLSGTLLVSSTNAIDIYPSGVYGGSSVGPFFNGYQSFAFSILRQDIIIPDGTYTDPRVAVSAGGAFTSTPTHNRLLIIGSYVYQSVSSPVINASSTYGFTPMSFILLGAASGASGSAYYTTGLGNCVHYAGGYWWRPAASTDVYDSNSGNFAFTLELRPGSYASNPLPISMARIVRTVAKKLKLEYEPSIDLSIIRV
jgi:hypothetical protein